MTESSADTGLSKKQKARYYKKGKKHLKKKHYSSAYTAFIKAGDYSNSKKLASKCVGNLIDKHSKSTMFAFWKLEGGLLKKAAQNSKNRSDLKHLKFINGCRIGNKIGVIDSSGVGAIDVTDAEVTEPGSGPYNPLPNNSSKSKKDSYNDGYNDVWDHDSYDEDRYRTDRDYDRGVDDALDEYNEEYGDEYGDEL